MWSLHRPGVHRRPDSALELVASWDLEDLGVEAESYSGSPGDESGPDGDAHESEVEPEVDAELLEQQRREAERLAHERELAAAFARGRDEGIAEGLAEGERSATERLRSAVQAAEQALAALRAGEEQWTGGTHARENICALAVGVARHIIARKVSADSKIVRDLTRMAIAEFPIDEPLRIRVNPDDLAAIEGASEIVEIVGGRTTNWVADPTIARGGCLVESREHIVDGRVDTALERVYRQLSDTHA